MWHYERDGQPVGPISELDITNLTKTGQIADDTLVWRNGMAEWTPLGETDLREFIQDPLPPISSSPPPMTPSGGRGSARPVEIGDNGGTYESASWGRRVLAMILDSIFLAIMLVIVISIVGNFSIYYSIFGSSELYFLYVDFLIIATGILYYGCFSSSKKQATPGKRIMSIYVVKTTGNPIRFWLGVGRYLSYIISGLFFNIGFLMPLWTKNNRALHDFICNTRVVSGKL